MAYPRTFQDIQTLVIARLNLDATADLTMVKEEINTAYDETVIETEALQTSQTYTLTPGTASYSLASVLTNAIARIKVIQITYGGVTFPPLLQITLDELIRKRIGAGGVAVATGTATHYALNGLNDLELYPTPLSADVATFWYSYHPTALSGNSDVPAIPEPYSTRCLVNGSCAELADLTGDPAAGDYFQKYETAKGKFRQHLNRRKGGQPGVFVDFPAPLMPPHDRSTLYSGGEWY